MTAAAATPIGGRLRRRQGDHAAGPCPSAVANHRPSTLSTESADVRVNLEEIGNDSVPIQLAQCRFPDGLRGHFQCSNINIFFQTEYAEAILSNSTRKLLWFEISKMMIAVYKNNFIVLFITIFGTLSFPTGNDFRHSRLPSKHISRSVQSFLHV